MFATVAHFTPHSLRLRIAAFAAAACAAGWVIAGDARTATAAATEPLVVVELFTSQGCASCPPADAYLGEIAQRKGVLALSQHVDYWNYMGWKDPFSSSYASKRQKAYANGLSQRYVYTPQIVVDGKAQGVGSNRDAIESLLTEARRAIDKKLPLRVYRGTFNEVKLVLPNAPAKKKDSAEAVPTGATVWLVAYDDSHISEVSRGENRGKTLTNHNVVRAMRVVGQWEGKRQILALDLAEEIAAGYGHVAVLLQVGKYGPIVAAAKLPWPVASIEQAGPAPD